MAQTKERSFHFKVSRKKHISSLERWKEEEWGFVSFYSTTSRESEVKWTLVVGGESETMNHVNESHKRNNRQKGGP